MSYYYDEKSSPMVTLVADAGHHGGARPCPFSGHYTLGGGNAIQAFLGLRQPREIDDTVGDDGDAQCAPGSSLGVSMQAGCSGSSGLSMNAACLRKEEAQDGPTASPYTAGTEPSSKARETTLSFAGAEFTCHGKWTEDDWPDDASGGLAPTPVTVGGETALVSYRRPSASRRPRSRHHLILSAGPRTLRQADNSLSRRYLCLTYAEQSGGVLFAEVSDEGCDNAALIKSRQTFNITSSGPCLQALTGGGAQRRPWHSSAVAAAAVLIVIVVGAV